MEVLWLIGSLSPLLDLEHWQLHWMMLGWGGVFGVRVGQDDDAGVAWAESLQMLLVMPGWQMGACR